MADEEIFIPIAIEVRSTGCEGWGPLCRAGKDDGDKALESVQEHRGFKPDRFEDPGGGYLGAENLGEGGSGKRAEGIEAPNDF